MPLTVADYESLMQHAIGGAPDSRVSLLNVLNDALRFLFDSHPWSFRGRPILSATSTIGQNYLVLPADFGELLSVHNGWRLVQITSLQDIAHRRANTWMPPPLAAVYCAISWPAQPTNTSLQNSLVLSDPNNTNSALIPSGPLLELFPNVATATTYTIEYRAGAIQLVNTTDVPNIPPNFERALGLLARAFLIDLEEQDASSEWAKVNEELAKLKDHDGLTQQNMGLMEGGAVGGGRRRVNFWVSEVTR